MNFSIAQRKSLILCNGSYALCSASTCEPTERLIQVQNEWFREAVCVCPVFEGEALGELNGGTMGDSCDPPNNGIWSLFSIQCNIPQEKFNWSSNWHFSQAPIVVCPASLDLGKEFVNCFSFACQKTEIVNNVQLAECWCAMGNSLRGLHVPLQTGFVTQAGGGDPNVCFQHPVAGPFAFQNELRNAI